jgi:hypothetical protein
MIGVIRGGCAAVLFVTLASCGLPVSVGQEQARAARAAPTVPAETPRIVASRPAPGAPRAAAPSVTRASSPQAAPAAAQEPPRPTGPAVLNAPTVPQPTAEGDIVGLRLSLDNPGRRRFVTFGQVFAPGAVPRGVGVVARGSAGDLPTQLDVKTTHPDGSARMGIITVLTERSDALMLRRGPIQAAAPVVLGVGGGYDQRIRVNVTQGAEPVARDYIVGALLADALTAGRASYWLRGPLTTEAQIAVSVTGSLRLVLDVRGYADGSVMTDIRFQNDVAMGPVGGQVTYDVTITAGNRTALHKAGLHHFHYQTWHHQLWSEGPPGANLVHDVAALARAGAVFNYDLRTGVDAGMPGRLVASMNGPGFDILGNAGIAKYMPMTGGRSDIGPTTLPNTVWLMTMHPDAARFALAQADGAGSIPWHFHDATANEPISPARHPKLWADGRGGRWGTVGFTQTGEDTGWALDTAHQPDLSYIPYILTGLRYRWDQLESQALYCVLSQDANKRGGVQSIVLHDWQQVRGMAWAFRALDHAAFIAPDDAPLRTYLREAVAHNIAHLRAEADRLTVGENFGFVGSYPARRDRTGVAPWQMDFLSSVLSLSALRGTAGAKELVDWMLNFVAGRFTAGAQGFRPNNGTAFGLVTHQVGPRGEVITTWRDLEQVNIELGIARDNDTLAGSDENTMRIARGALGATISATGSNRARRALDWVNANLPGISQDAYRRSDPTWNIIPLPR